MFKKTSCILTLFFLCSFFYQENSKASSFTVSEDDALFMTVVLSDGLLVSQAMEVFKYDNDYFIPFGQLTNDLNVAIKVSTSLKKAEGFFVDENYRFAIDHNKCEVVIKNASEKYNCQKIFIYNDELYIGTAELETWLPIKFDIDNFASKVMISSRLRFPEQAKRDRERKAVAKVDKNQGLPKGYFAQKTPYVNFGNFSFDQQLQLQQQKIQEEKKTNFRHDTAMNAEIFGFNTKAFVGGEQENIEEWNLNLSKKSNQAELLGVMKAREIQLVDIHMPSVPLISSGRKGRGILVSSFPLINTNNFDSRSFRGDLPSSWEVELYHDDILVGRQSSGTSTEYNFKDINVHFGLNIFRLVFYGPQGQKKEKLQVINIGNKSIKKSDFFYRFSAVDNTDIENENTLLLQTEKGISENLALHASLARLKTKNDLEAINYWSTGVNASFGRTFNSLHLIGNDINGSAAKVSSQIPFKRSSLTINHSEFSEFTSDEISKLGDSYLKSLSSMVVSYNPSFISRLQLSLEAEVRAFDNDFKEETYLQRTAYNFAGIHWFNSYSFSPQDPSSKSGELSALTTFGRAEVRPTIRYEKKPKEYSLDFRYNFKNAHHIGVSAQHINEGNLNQFRLSYSREFKSFTLTANAEADNMSNYLVSMILSYSGIQGNQTLNMFSRAQVDYGSVNTFVYLDNNQNGKFDPEPVKEDKSPNRNKNSLNNKNKEQKIYDRPLKDIEVLINQNYSKRYTDSDGNVLIPHLPPFQKTDISLSMRSFPDPVFHFPKKGVRVEARPGVVSRVELPVVVLGEVEGYVNLKEKNNLRGRKLIEVQLKDLSGNIISSVKTDYDGFFVLDKVAPGNYNLCLNDLQLNELGLKSVNKNYSITVPATGLLDKIFEFTVYK